MNKVMVLSALLLVPLLFSASPAKTLESAKTISFKTKKIELAGKKLTVEVAESPEEVQRGLMFRTDPLSNDQGMLFVFEKERELSFWMKNTFIPLSIGFFDKNKKLVYITSMTPVRSEMETPKSYPCPKPAMYALEVAEGWFEKNNVSLGAVFKYR